MKQSLTKVTLFYLLLCSFHALAFEAMLRNRIIYEPQQIADEKSISVEATYNTFFAVPCLQEASVSFCYPFAGFASAVALSSISLDSIYGDLSASLATGFRYKCIAIGALLGGKNCQTASNAGAFESNVLLAASINMTDNLIVRFRPPSLRVYEESALLSTNEWSIGAMYRHKDMQMIISMELLQNVNGDFSVRLFQLWRAGSYLSVSGSIESEPLKFGLGIHISCRRINISLQQLLNPQIGSIRTVGIGYSERSHGNVFPLN